MVKSKAPIDVQKLSQAKNLRLKEMLAEIADESGPGATRSSRKPTWGRRFNASGKHMVAPTIRFSYDD